MTGSEFLSLLVYFNFIIASVALRLRWLALYNNGNRQQAGQWAMFVWIAHVWLFYAVSAGRRLFFDMHTPSLFMSAWASGLLLHALGALAMDAHYYLKRHNYWKKYKKHERAGLPNGGQSNS